MSIILLGGTGFVGRNVSQVLEFDGIEHTKVSRASGVDLRDFQQVLDFFSEIKPSVIVNCAAHVGSLNYVTQQAADVIVDNTQMTLALYQAVAKSKLKPLIINPIANCAYPANLEIYSEEKFWDGSVHRSVLSYGSARRHMLATSECFRMQYGIRTVSLLVPNMYGPYDSTDPNKAHAMNALIAKFTKAKKENVPEISIWGTGVAIREWLLAKDFARIVVQIIRKPELLGLDEELNIAQNFGLSVREIVSIISQRVRYTGRISYDHSKSDGAPKKVMNETRFRKVFPHFLCFD